MFGGGGRNDSSGVSQSLFGLWLGWMSDQAKRGGAYVVVAMNDPTVIPPEALRQGRFDDGFFFGLPNPAARVEICRIHLAKRMARNGVKLDALGYGDDDWTAIAAATNDLLPADIETCVSVAMFRAFVDRRSKTPTIEELLDAVSVRFGTDDAKAGLAERRTRVALMRKAAAAYGARTVADESASKATTGKAKMSKTKSKQPPATAAPLSLDDDDDDEDDN